MNWLSKRLPRKRWKRVILYAASTVFVALAIDMSLTAYWRHITISKETTYITAPLLPEGMPDYITWLNDRAAQGVTPENNAAVPLVRAFGLPPSDSPNFAEWEARTLRALGLPDVHIPTRKDSFVLWMRDQAGGPAPATNPQAPDPSAKWAAEETAMRSAPWTAAEHPSWAKWIATQQDALALAHEAATRDHYYVPLYPREMPFQPGQVFAMLLPTLGPTRGLTDLVMAEAMMHARDADKHIFVRNVTDTLTLGALMDTQDVLITRMVGEALTQEACAGIRAALASGDLKREDAQVLLTAVNALPPARPLELVGERCGMLDLFGASAIYGLGRYPLTGNQPTAAPLISLLVPVRYEAQMRMVNAAYDKLDEDVRLPSYAKRVQAVRATEQDMYAHYDKALLLFSGYIQAVLSVSGDPIWMPKACENLQKSATDRDLTRLALALAIYFADKGTYPDGLESLTRPAGILTSVPLDGFSDAPFVYRREGTGYLLYSVGPDLKDDGGSDKDDLAVSMER